MACITRIMFRCPGIGHRVGSSGGDKALKMDEVRRRVMVTVLVLKCPDVGQFY